MAYAPTQPGVDTSGIGVANAQALTLMHAMPFEPNYPAEAAMQDGENLALNGAAHPAGGNPVWVVVALLGGLVLLGFLRKQSSHLEGQTIALNAFNFTLMILTVMIGFVLLKVLVAKFPIPGVTQLVHAA